MFICEVDNMKSSKFIIPKLEIQFFHVLQIVTSNQLTEEERKIPKLNVKGNFRILLRRGGTNNIISKALRNQAQQSFSQVKPQRKMRSLIFLLSEAQRNFRNELFDLVEA